MQSIIHVARSSASVRWKFWIDRGGTFTDLVAKSDTGASRTLKLLSDNPAAYDDAAVAGIRQVLQVKPGAKVPAGRIAQVRMGTTVATNALLERAGESLVLIVTAGFADLLRIGDQRRANIFALAPKRPASLYRRVIEVDERVRADGTVERKPDLKALIAKLAAARTAGCTAAAVVCMHSYRYPAHERMIARACRANGFDQVYESAAIEPVIGAVARGHTAVVDAYLSPLLARYVEKVSSELAGARVEFMQSNGGLAAAKEFAGRNAILSGPAGGVVGAIAVARRQGLERIVSVDMGGTSTDVAHWAGSLERVTETEFGSFSLRMPMLAVNTVAAGGGSICELLAGRLAVGPSSAGSDPGPACYRRGGPLTVTDCNLALGKLQPDCLPAVFGPKRNELISPSAANKRLAPIAKATGASSAQQLAADFVAVAVERMAAAIKAVSLSRGHDISSAYALVPFGGAGGQHACLLAERLGIDKIAIHPQAGVLSAIGIGLAAVRAVRQQSLEISLAGGIERLQRAAAKLASQARAQVRAAGLSAPQVVCRATLRYEGMSASLAVRIASQASMRRSFVRAHRKQFGFIRARERIIIDAAEAEASSGVARMRDERASTHGSEKRKTRTVKAYSGGKQRKTMMLQRSDMTCDEIIMGPAIIQDATATTFVEPGWHACTNSLDNLILTKVRKARKASSMRRASLVASPARLEVFNSIFMSIAEQMGHVLRNTASSVNIKDRLDFSCALFDAAGNMVANGPHIPVHLGSMSDSVRAVLAANKSSIKPGDSYLLNSPYAGGTHLPDLTVVTPAFAAGAKRPFGFVCSRGHHADIGGITPGSMPADAQTIEQEGILIDCFRIVRAGRVDEAGFRRLLSDSAWPARNPDENMADLIAQQAANAKGTALLAQLVAEHGLATVAAFMMHVQDNAAAAVRKLLATLNGGKFTVANDDGSKICVAISINRKRGSASVDFAGTSAQQKNNANAPLAVVRAAVVYVLRTMIDVDIPLNEGFLRPITLRVARGCMLNPHPPAAVAAGNVETSQGIVDAMLGAFGVAAASQGTMNNLTFGNANCQYYETVCGGVGATASIAGADAVHTHMTNSRITDPEILEQRLPVVLEEFAVRKRSGGVGKMRGGNGCRRIMRFLEPMQLSILANRRSIAPYGAAGGKPGACARNWLERADGSQSKGQARVAWDAKAGDRLVMLTPGGGGWGKKKP